MSAPRRARPRSRATKRAYCRRHRPVAAPDNGRQSPVQQGTVVGMSTSLPAQAEYFFSSQNEPIVRWLNKIGCEVL